MSNQREHITVTKKIESSNEWVDSEQTCDKGSSEIISESISTQDMRRTNIGDDIIGFAGSAFQGGQNFMNRPGSPYDRLDGSIDQIPETISTIGGSQHGTSSNITYTKETITSNHIHSANCGCDMGTITSDNIDNCTCDQSTIASGHSANCAYARSEIKYPIVPNSGKVVDCCKYELNKDSTPNVIVKHPDRPIHYDQNIGVRYLQPPTPAPPGKIIVREVRPQPVPECEPLYVKIRPVRQNTPPPLIIREAPPLPPKPLPTVVIDKFLPPAPPPPRRVIVEKLPPLPPKPRQVIIEKWLPYEKIKREIVYQKLPDLAPTPIVKNTLIKWSPFKASITKRFHNLGIVQADPLVYSSQYGGELMDSQSTMHAMNQFGAQLHHQNAYLAETSGQNVYTEDKGELDRLMNTNFHPNDPVCRQYLERNMGSFNQGFQCPESYATQQNVYNESQNMAHMYNSNACADQYSMHGPLNVGQRCVQNNSWFQSAYGNIDQCQNMNLQQDVFGMYPEYCEGAELAPMICPYVNNIDHTYESCMICQQLLIPPPY